MNNDDVSMKCPYACGKTITVTDNFKLGWAMSAHMDRCPKRPKIAKRKK